MAAGDRSGNFAKGIPDGIFAAVLGACALDLESGGSRPKSEISWEFQRGGGFVTVGQGGKPGWRGKAGIGHERFLTCPALPGAVGQASTLSLVLVADLNHEESEVKKSSLGDVGGIPGRYSPTLLALSTPEMASVMNLVIKAMSDSA